MSEKLTEFSKAVKAQFFGSFPLLLKLENKIIENEDGAFYIEIKVPSANVEHPLSIDTYGEEVTVAFDVYHAHYNEFFTDVEYGSALSL